MGERIDASSRVHANAGMPLMKWLPGLRRPVFDYVRLNWQLRELSGAMGDLGTFLPIFIALCSEVSLNPSLVLFWSGLSNLVTALSFPVPMPVQPMKALAAAAIVGDLSRSQLLLSGFVVGVIVMFVGISGLATSLRKYIPLPLVRGIQLGLGLALGIKGLKLVLNAPGSWVGVTSSGWTPDNYVCALLAFILIAFCEGTGTGRNMRVDDPKPSAQLDATNAHTKRAKIPSALLTLLLGFILAIPAAACNGTLVVRIPTPFRMDWTILGLPPDELGYKDVVVALLNGVLPQLPMTLLNSVLAVCALALDLFPGDAGVKESTTVCRVATSVGLLNMLTCPFGGMPQCHGAGGLAGQFKFGARSSVAVFILGTFKLVLALLLGSSFHDILALFPQSILGVMLFVSSSTLALSARDVASRGTEEDFGLVIFVAIACAAINTGVGFALGILLIACQWVKARCGSSSRATPASSTRATPPVLSSPQPNASRSVSGNVI